MYMHVYLTCKSCILVPDDGPQVPEHVAFTDDTRRLLRLTVTNKLVLLTQHNGLNSIKIYLLPLALRPRTELTPFWLDFKHPSFPNYQHVCKKNALYISGNCFAKFKQCRASSFATVSAAFDFNRWRWPVLDILI
jgi:hypothetical protein